MFQVQCDPTLGFFTNAGNTLREGVDIGATYTTDRWDVYASYSYIKATFLTPIALSSPNNPTADPDTGEIQVLPGDNIPGIPNHKFKFGMDYEVLPDGRSAVTWSTAPASIISVRKTTRWAGSQSAGLWLCYDRSADIVSGHQGPPDLRSD